MKPSEAGKWVYQHLSVQGVTAIVGDKIYPYVTGEPKVVPWIVYDGIVLDYGQTKDSNEAETLTATVKCAASNYDDAMRLADAVYDALNDVDDCIVVRVQGEYTEDVGHLEEMEIQVTL